MTNIQVTKHFISKYILTLFCLLFSLTTFSNYTMLMGVTLYKCSYNIINSRKHVRSSYLEECSPNVSTALYLLNTF